MFESMQYFGLNHRRSSGVKVKLNEVRRFILESPITYKTKYTVVRYLH